MDAINPNLNLIRQEIIAYAKPSLAGNPSYLTESSDGKLISVIDVDIQANRHQAAVSLAVRIESDYIIIEDDKNNKPLVDALVQAGIPREQIILAYAGEPVPESNQVP